MDWRLNALAISLAVTGILALAYELRKLRSSVRSAEHMAFLLWGQLSDLDRDVYACQIALQDLKADNPHARLLGKTVEYRKYEASDWQLGVVWCVGIHGGLCIRDADYLDAPGKWIKSDKVTSRVREVRDA